MKRVLVCLVICTSCLSGYTQIESDDLLIGGNISLSQTNRESTKFFGFSFNPYIAYFVLDKLAIGSGMGINYYKNKYKPTQAPESTSSNIQLSINPGLRFYPGQYGALAPFVEFYTKFSSSVNKSTSFLGPDQSRTSQDLRLGLGGGLAYFLTSSVAIDSRLVVERHSSKDFKSYYSTLFTMGLQVHLSGNSRSVTNKEIE